MKIRYHDTKGRERWAALGETVPAGSYINNGQFKLTKDNIVRRGMNEGNPYDQVSRQEYYLFFEEK